MRTICLYSIIFIPKVKNKHSFPIVGKDLQEQPCVETFFMRASARESMTAASFLWHQCSVQGILQNFGPKHANLAHLETAGQ